MNTGISFAFLIKFLKKQLHGIKLITSQCDENQGSKLSGRSDKTFDIDFIKQSRKQKQYCFALARGLSDAAQGVREEQTRKHSPQSGPGGEVSYF